jgi:hypothetical protein
MVLRSTLVRRRQKFQYLGQDLTAVFERNEETYCVKLAGRITIDSSPITTGGNDAPRLKPSEAIRSVGG